MFFGLSKIFWSLAQPLNALCLLALLGFALRLRWYEQGQKIVNVCLALILLLGVVPIGPVLMTWLERQYPTPAALPARIDGIIVLGGPFESYLTKATGHIVSNSQIDRVFCFVEIAKQHPEAKLVYSGGPGDILNPDSMESNDAKMFFKLVGMSDRKIEYEERSRNTYENVLYTMEMMDPKAKEHWVVATSGYHMPRTMGIFEKFKWRVTPYECDPRTDGTYTDVFTKIPNVTDNFGNLNIAMKELIGSVVYYVTGKSAFILPPSKVSSRP